jgi:hypothetical protein
MARGRGREHRWLKKRFFNAKSTRAGDHRFVRLSPNQAAIRLGVPVFFPALRHLQ